MPFEQETFCILPWVHLNLNPNGTLKICCKASSNIQSNAGEASIYQQTLQEIWKSDDMCRIRQTMLEGKALNECITCYSDEEITGSSYRKRQNVFWLESFPHLQALVEETRQYGIVSSSPVFYQIQPGTLCNLKCRMCSAKYSSQIERDSAHRQWADQTDTGTIVGSRFSSDLPWHEQKIFIKELLADKVEKLYFTGGEPLLIRSVIRIIDEIIRRGIAGDIILKLNTNATKVSDEFLEKAVLFKSVEISLSLDAYGQCHEYMRYPARWRDIEHGISRLISLPNVHLVAVPIIQTYNVLYLSDLLDYLEKLKIPCSITILSWPSQLRIWSLPANVLKEAFRRVALFVKEKKPTITKPAALSFMRQLESGKSIFYQDSLHDFMLFTNDLDRSRKQSFAKSFPDLIDLLLDAGITWQNEIFSRKKSPTNDETLTWLSDLYLKGYILADVFKKRSMRRIAVYGIGVVGKIITQDLSADNEIELFLVDKNLAGQEYCSKEIYSLEQFDEEVDVVLISVTRMVDAIRLTLKNSNIKAKTIMTLGELIGANK